MSLLERTRNWMSEAAIRHRLTLPLRPAPPRRSCAHRLWSMRSIGLARHRAGASRREPT